jgi:predicted polyphosphate/ATP-dependent NAD kinase
MRRIGLIVNPIAGIGGRLGFKSSDGALAKKARELGGASSAPHRTVETLRGMLNATINFTILTYPSDMGQNEALESGFDPTVIGCIQVDNTTAEDTRRAVRDLIEEEVELILFSGGDGTARDIMEILGERIPVVGIPAGVKMHSGVFAINPKLAGTLAINFLSGQTITRSVEVVDYDDADNLKLYGYMRVPYDQALVQDTKSPTLVNDGGEAIAAGIIEELLDDYAYIVGPGTTAKTLMKLLKLPYTLLGVDIVKSKQLLIQDANETQLLDVVNRFKSKILIGVIGGQGFLFGRGNQQISPRVIRHVGKHNLIIVATEAKIASLRGRPLLVDSGDEQLDKSLVGYIKVNVGYRTSVVCRVAQSRA